DPEPDPAPEPEPEPDPEPDPEPEPEPEPDPDPDPEPTPTGKSIVFAKGVSIDAGWYDVNKIGSGQTNGDINMCWAASSSNIIEWWQDRYREAGFELPEGAVTGRGEKYDLALMEMFHSEWDNSRGGHVNHAVHWYFEGKNICKEASPGSQAQPLREDSGGYYRDIWDEIYPHLYHEYEHLGGLYKGLYAGEFNNYYLWGNGVPNLSGEQRLRRFSTYVVDAIRRGVPSLAIALSPNLSSLHHATTLWGYEIDNATGLLTRVWITDSDDMTTEPKHPVLHEYSVSVSGYNTIQLSGAPYGACYVVTLLPVSGYDMF
ncbi:MAG: IdeS/Mac family cysteine endopeptidase, partial [Alistipes sp.]|nr:IdeS/Mac family cysteine endopeptidase [Alistipes sp.]